MASLTDLANQVNNTLLQIETNTRDTSDTTALIKGDTADIKGRLDTVITRLESIENTNSHGFTVLNTTLNNGFSLLGQGLFAILEANKQTNAHLETQISQNDAIICWLYKIAKLLCLQLRELQRHTELTIEILETVKALEGILELVHAREFVEYQRKLELEEKIDECCPPDPWRPKPCFEPCPDPKTVEYKPQGQDWTPKWQDEQKKEEIPSKSNKKD